jgi:20S proteasome subunit alpha 4
MPSYDKAITVFAPDGQLFQVQYAFEAVNRGSCTIAMKGKDCVVLCVEKNTVPKLQDSRTIRKIQKIDEHLTITFAGLQADARVLIDKTRQECQSYRFGYEDEPSIEYVSRFVAETQQKYTQKGGVRPFGISCFIAGFEDGLPKLYLTEPSGAFAEWKAHAIGKKSKDLHQFLEDKYEHHGQDKSEDEIVKFALETLMEIVEDQKSMEVCVVRQNGSETMSEEDVGEIVAGIKKERDDAEAAKKAKKQ